MTKLYQVIGTLLESLNVAIVSGHRDWAEKREDLLQSIESELLPRGSGIDSGVKIVRDIEHNKYYLDLDFHHMNEHGSYDGWTHHKLAVTPTWKSFDLEFVQGEDRNDIQEYLIELMYCTLDKEVELYEGQYMEVKTFDLNQETQKERVERVKTIMLPDIPEHAAGLANCYASVVVDDFDSYAHSNPENTFADFIADWFVPASKSMYEFAREKWNNMNDEEREDLYGFYNKTGGSNG